MAPRTPHICVFLEINKRVIGAWERIDLLVYEDKCLLALLEGALCSVTYNPLEQRAGLGHHPADLGDVVTMSTPGESKMVGKPRV